MKKILLATTLLAASAGYASADITWAGSATAGIAQNGTSNGGAADPNGYELATGKAAGSTDDRMLSYSSANLAVTFAGQTDSGLTFGATFDETSGVSYALADDDGFSTNGGAFGGPAVFISGSFGKITFNTDGLDGFDGDEAADGDYDVQYDGTFGAATVGVEADLDSGMMGAKVGYTAGNLALAASYSLQPTGIDAIWDVSTTYTIGAIAITAATDNASASSVQVAFTGANGMTASAKYNTNLSPDAASIDLAGGYTANGLSVSASVSDVSGANGDATWTVTASYDLGGGLSVEAGTNYTSDMMVGAKMSF